MLLELEKLDAAPVRTHANPDASRWNPVIHLQSPLSAARPPSPSRSEQSLSLIGPVLTGV
jgi:hypothetical protein